ncbi:MAG: metallophosphoesterase [Clostridia bacterium]|nr:metallophosphoesterase [Clostridia bacterium]
MNAFRLLLIPVILAIALYFYFFLRRMLQTFGAPVNKRPLQIGIGAVSLLLGWFSSDIMGDAAVVVLHVFMLAVLMHPIHFAMRKIFSKRSEKTLGVWKKIYGSGAIPILLSALLLVSGYFNLHNVVQTSYTVHTDKDIRDGGYRIALIADVHFGVSLDYNELLEKCQEINTTKPDIVILCGDIIDGSTTDEQMNEVYRALGTLKSEFGTYYVHGNHDRPFSYDSYTYTYDDQIRAMKENGIIVLQDDVVQITDDFVLVGREDRSADRFGYGKRASLTELFDKVDTTDFVLTLDHQPNEYAENGKIGTDLLLSGHTHGGQLFPLNLLMKIIPFNDGVYGRYEIDADTTAIITSGFAGWNYPVKTAAPAEYVIIDVVGK